MRSKPVFIISIIGLTLMVLDFTALSIGCSPFKRDIWEMFLPVFIIFTIIFLFSLSFSFNKVKSSTITGRVIFVGAIIFVVLMMGIAVWFFDLGRLFGAGAASSPRENLRTIYNLLGHITPLILFFSLIFSFAEDKPLTTTKQSIFVGITGLFLLLALLINCMVKSDSGEGWGVMFAYGFFWSGITFLVILGFLGGALVGYIIKKKVKRARS